MKATHVLSAIAPCPSGLQEHDYYRIEVEADRMIRVEEIEAAVDELTTEPVFQEDLTEALADRLGAVVRTLGKHNKTLTEVEAGSLEREAVPA